MRLYLTYAKLHSELISELNKTPLAFKGTYL